jgi:hypothetical protein
MGSIRIRQALATAAHSQVHVDVATTASLSWMKPAKATETARDEAKCREDDGDPAASFRDGKIREVFYLLTCAIIDIS